MNELEAEDWTVVVTPISVKLTVRTLTDVFYTVVIPRKVGEDVARTILKGLETTPEATR